MLVIPCRLHVISFPIAPQNVPTGIKKDENVWLTDRIMSNALMKKTRRQYMVDNFTQDRQMLMIMVADAIREIGPVAKGAMTSERSFAFVDIFVETVKAISLG